LLLNGFSLNGNGGHHKAYDSIQILQEVMDVHFHQESQQVKNGYQLQEQEWFSAEKVI